MNFNSMNNESDMRPGPQRGRGGRGGWTPRGRGGPTFSSPFGSPGPQQSQFNLPGPPPQPPTFNSPGPQSPYFGGQRGSYTPRGSFNRGGGQNFRGSPSPYRGGSDWNRGGGRGDWNRGGGRGFSGNQNYQNKRGSSGFRGGARPDFSNRKSFAQSSSSENFNPRDYVIPAMTQNPWAQLEKEYYAEHNASQS